jgi:hypothetical protein
METRRILRLERRRAHRTALLAVMCAVLGLAIGMMLPSSTTASVVLLAVAVACLAAVVLHAESFAPLHGLHRVVRLPFLRSISATFASFRARVVGSLRALRHLRPSPSPIVLDELDEDAAAWWGATAAPPPAASVPVPSVPVPSAPVPSVPVPSVPAPYAPSDSGLPAPVLAAPLPSAHVSVSVTHRVRARVAQVRDGARQHVKGLRTKTRVGA